MPRVVVADVAPVIEIEVRLVDRERRDLVGVRRVGAEAAERDVVKPERRPTHRERVAERDEVDLLVAERRLAFALVHRGEALKGDELELEPRPDTRKIIEHVAGNVDQVVLVFTANDDVHDRLQARGLDLGEGLALAAEGEPGATDGVGELGGVAVDRELDELEPGGDELGDEALLREHRAVGGDADAGVADLFGAREDPRQVFAKEGLAAHEGDVAGAALEEASEHAEDLERRRVDELAPGAVFLEAEDAALVAPLGDVEDGRARHLALDHSLRAGRDLKCMLGW